MENCTYEIWWRGEAVDECDTFKEAQFLRREYNLAFGGGCKIKRVRA